MDNIPFANLLSDKINAINPNLVGISTRALILSIFLAGFASSTCAQNTTGARQNSVDWAPGGHYVKPIHLLPGQIAPGANVSAKTGRNAACSLAVGSYKRMAVPAPAYNQPAQGQRPKKSAAYAVASTSSHRPKVALYDTSGRSSPYYSEIYYPVATTFGGSSRVSKIDRNDDPLSFLDHADPNGSLASTQPKVSSLSGNTPPPGKIKQANAYLAPDQRVEWSAAIANAAEQRRSAVTLNRTQPSKPVLSLLKPSARSLEQSVTSAAPSVPERQTTTKKDTGTDNGQLPELNAKVLQFAIEHLGQQVGNGECATLAVDGLLKAGAKPAGFYVFGRELGKNEAWLPGDIIQFTSCRFVERISNRTITWNVGSPRHTAIIYILSNGLVQVLHQHVNGDRHVQTQTLNFSAMVSGKIQVYRPLPNR